MVTSRKSKKRERERERDEGDTIIYHKSPGCIHIVCYPRQDMSGGSIIMFNVIKRLERNESTKGIFQLMEFIDA